jgi:hypothetical protein
MGTEGKLLHPPLSLFIAPIPLLELCVQSRETRGTAFKWRLYFYSQIHSNICLQESHFLSPDHPYLPVDAGSYFTSFLPVCE